MTSPPAVSGARFVSCVAALLLVLSVSGRAAAQCTLPAEVEQLRRSLDAALLVREGPAVPLVDGSSVSQPPPACAGTLVADAVSLAYGASPGPLAGLRSRSVETPQATCQKTIGRAAADFITRRMRSLIAGRTPEQASRDARGELDPIEAMCNVTVTAGEEGGTVPHTGLQCSPAIGPPGSSVNAPALGSCLDLLLTIRTDQAQGTIPPKLPNVVLILTDDQRWDAVDSTHSVSGNAVMPQVLSEIAAQGITFTNSYATTPICCPSRASLLSGEYAHNHNVLSNSSPLGGARRFDDSSTLATVLRSRGYLTGLYGKYLNEYDKLWLPGESPYVPPGWTSWTAFKLPSYYDYILVENGVEVQYGSAPTDYSTDVLRTKALSFINQSVASGKPFFLYFAPFGPHEPYIPAPRHVGSFAGLTPWRPANYNELDVSDKPSWLRNTPLLTAPQRQQIDMDRIAQLETVQSIDEAVGQIMLTLKTLDIIQNTIVIFSSDNGFIWGEHRLEGKGDLYEEDLRVPLYIRYPPLAPLPRVESRPVLNIDLAPTITALTGAPSLASADGLDLVRLNDNNPAAWRDDFMTEVWFAEDIVGEPPAASVHDSQWSYTELASGEQELYDLTGDPLELANAQSGPANEGLIVDRAARLRAIRPGWPADAGCVDADGDGYSPPGNPGCSTPILDCSDTNTLVWDTPGEVPILSLLSDRQTLTWNPPVSAGGVPSILVYDTLRSNVASDFDTASCVESNDGTDTAASDPATPATGTVFYYLVRAENACPSGSGSLGTDSWGNPRSGRACP